MADSIELNNPDPSHALPRSTRAERAMDGRGAADGGPSASPADTPDAMRREIQRTRARMSATLDTLEVRLGREKAELSRKKDELWGKATLKDFRHAVTREPWRSLAIAFVAGYIVAALRD